MHTQNTSRNRGRGSRSGNLQGQPRSRVMLVSSSSFDSVSDVSILPVIYPPKPVWVAFSHFQPNALTNVKILGSLAPNKSSFPDNRVPYSLQDVLWMLFHLILTISSWGGFYYYLGFIGKTTRAQRYKVFSSRSRGWIQSPSSFQATLPDPPLSLYTHRGAAGWSPGWVRTALGPEPDQDWTGTEG